MTRLTALFGILSFTAIAAPSTPAASGFNIGYVDLKKAMQSVDSGKAAKAALEREMTAKRTELEKAQQQLQNDAEQFEKKAAIMNESAKAAKQAELQKRFAEFQKAAAESQMELQKREQELTNPIIDELRLVIEGIGREKGLQLVVEKTAVLYAAAGSDITDTVIEHFNQRAKTKTKKK